MKIKSFGDSDTTCEVGFSEGGLSEARVFLTDALDGTASISTRLHGDGEEIIGTRKEFEVLILKAQQAIALLTEAEAEKELKAEDELYAKLVNKYGSIENFKAHIFRRQKGALTK